MLQSNDRIGKTERYHYCRPARSPQRPDIPPTYPPVDDHRLAQIVEMGFSTECPEMHLLSQEEILRGFKSTNIESRKVLLEEVICTCVCG